MLLPLFSRQRSSRLFEAAGKWLPQRSGRGASCLSKGQRAWAHRAGTSQPPRVEVESKFAFTEEDVRRIAEKARLLSSKIVHDTYWDKRDRFPLTTQDVWLRERNGRWEIKVPPLLWEKREQAERTPSSPFDHYVEVEEHVSILAFLHRGGHVAPSSRGIRDLAKRLSQEGFRPFAALTTHRTCYVLEQVTLVLDHVEPTGYRIGELEVLLEPGAPREAAEERLRAVANLLDLKLASGVPGKVLHYIRTRDPLHWAALQQSGLLASKGIRVL